MCVCARQTEYICVIQCNLFSVTVVRWFVVSLYQSHEGKKSIAVFFTANFNCISALVDNIQQGETRKNSEGERKRQDMGWRLRTKVHLTYEF